MWVLDLLSLSESSYVYINDLIASIYDLFFPLFICHICFGIIIIIALSMYYIVIVHP